MGLADLRTSCNQDDDVDSLGPDDFPEEPPKPRPGDPEYIHSVFYDEARFATEADRNALLQTVRDRFPPGLEWVPSPATVSSLPTEMRFYGANHTKQFRQNGFVAELERPRFNSGRSHARSALSQKAWDGFCANAVMAEALADACLKVPQQRRGNVMFPDVYRDVLTPILGKADKLDDTPGTKLLAYHQRLLVAPRTFTVACTAYLADPVTCRSAVTLGRSVLPSWTSDERRAIRRRMEHEIETWSNELGADFSSDGLVLWTAQALGVLRLQATEWRFRERLRYIISGEPEFANDERADPTKDDYVREEIRTIRDELEPRDDAFVIRRPSCTTWYDIKSLLVGGIGLKHETSHDIEPYYDPVEYSACCLRWLASWVSELRRFHSARLTGSLANLLQEIVTEQFDDISEYDRDVARLIRAEFPVAVWNEILAAARQCPERTEWIEVRYAWNENPVAAPVVERDGDAIVILGPLLTTNAQSQSWWAQRAELFRERRSLTM
ncbi:MAG: hypothetical protein HYX37_14735 [Rhizobiales bacterium]|nr:hypothetical protein [Hyphomicrobiales bacterium]